MRVGLGYTHDAPDHVSASASGPAGAVVVPTVVTAPAPDDDAGERLTLCSRADVVDGEGVTHTYYRESQNGRWLTSSGAICTGGPGCLSTDASCNWYRALVEDLGDRGE